jgi:CRISPR system Cascade subunit CasD
MTTVLLRLEGPLQAWATQSKFGIRDTDREPSKSGVLGLVGAALGMERDDDEQLARLRTLSMAVRVDRPGSLLRDYHTVGGGSFRDRSERAPAARRYFAFDADDDKVGSSCIPTERYYLQDAAFTVALTGAPELVERVAAALRTPHWPIFLGRRACVPSATVLMGVVDVNGEDAVRGAVIDEVDRKVRRMRLVVEAPPERDGEPRYDDPLSFRRGSRRYAVRYVKTDWLDVPETSEPAKEVEA